MADVITIEVKDPYSGHVLSWQAMNRRSAVNQAKIEAERGALVKVMKNGVVVWTNHDGPMR